MVARKVSPDRPRQSRWRFRTHPSLRPPGLSNDPAQFPTFEATLDKSRFGFESGSRGPFWQGCELAMAPSMQATFGACLDGPRFVLRGLRAISPYRPSGLPDGGAGTVTLPKRYGG